jgi:hypothetical protein
MPRRHMKLASPYISNQQHPAKLDGQSPPQFRAYGVGCGVFEFLGEFYMRARPVINLKRKCWLAKPVRTGLNDHRTK